MKMKIPKLPQFFKLKRKKLRATVATRRPLRIAATADYDEMAEPNMKLSRALLIVLLLHVVAVSGIIAFNAIKTRQSSSPLPVSASSDSVSPAGPIVKTDSSVSRVAMTQKETIRHDEARLARSPGKLVTKEDRKSEHPKAQVTAAIDPEKVYVVAKGENPVTIARKLKVSYDELLALNHIDDPRKLQIGQKLLIPNKTTKPKKTDE